MIVTPEEEWKDDDKIKNVLFPALESVKRR